jgi:hypothetical protein
MNATSHPQPVATGEVQLNRAAKEKLLLKVYRLAHWIELIRLFGYQTLPMETARQAIKPIAEKFGKEPVAEACEVMVEISTPDEEPVARLKRHIRRMVFQILGPEPTQEAIVSSPAPVSPKPEPRAPNDDAKKRKERARPRTKSEQKPVAANSNGPSWISIGLARLQCTSFPGFLMCLRDGFPRRVTLDILSRSEDPGTKLVFPWSMLATWT